MTRSDTVDQLLLRYPDEVRELAAAARLAICTWLPGVAEEADASAGLIGFGFGAG